MLKGDIGVIYGLNTSYMAPLYPQFAFHFQFHFPFDSPLLVSFVHLLGEGKNLNDWIHWPAGTSPGSWWPACQHLPQPEHSASQGPKYLDHLIESGSEPSNMSAASRSAFTPSTGSPHRASMLGQAVSSGAMTAADALESPMGPAPARQ